MESVARRRLIAISALTVLLGAAIGTMYALWAEFVPAFFFTSLAVWAVGVVLVFLLVRSRIEVGGLGGPNRTTEIPATPPSVPPTPELPLVIEPSPSRPELLRPVPAAPATAGPAPAAYVFRGFTLYQRGSSAKPIRFFSKKKGEVGTPIPLPSGFEAYWDPKKGKPALRAVAPSPLEEAAEEVETQLVGGMGKRCSAWTSIGIMCEKEARDGSPYCARHVNYKPESVTGQFEVNVPRGREAGKAIRGGGGAFEVRVGGRGPAKPLKIKPVEFEARIAKPVVKGRGRALRLPEFEVQHDRRAIKPFRNVKAGDFQVSAAKPLSKPLRLKEPNLVVRAPGSRGLKPLKLREPDLRIRSGAAPPPKPLKLREPNLRVRSGAAPAPKPLRVREPELRIRSTNGPAPKPLRLREPNLRVRSAAAHEPKPLKVSEPRVEVRRGVGRPGKPLRLKEPNLDVRAKKPKAAKPLHNISDAPMEVKKSGTLAAQKPFRLPETTLEVKSGASKPPKPFKSNPSDILVERDSKARSDVGVSGTKAPKRRGK